MIEIDDDAVKNRKRKIKELIDEGTLGKNTNEIKFIVQDKEEKK